MSDTGTVRVEQREAVATVMFDRPSARNAMTWAMYEALDAALDRLAADRELRVVIFRGAGGHFVAGTDITQFVDFKSGDDGVRYEQRLEATIAKLEALPAATIAAVDGFAVGGGLAIATACDLRIATPNARFGVPIARTVGNCLSMANYARLVANLGPSRTKAILYTGGFMSAAEAHALGYLVDVVDPARFDAAVDALAGRVAAHAPITLQVTREAVRRIVERSIADGDDLVRRAYGSADFHEGVSAFVEKRQPQWKGR